MSKKDAERMPVNFNVAVPEAGQNAIITFDIDDCLKLMEALKCEGLGAAMDKFSALDIAAIRAGIRIGLKGGDPERLERGLPLEELAANLIDAVMLRRKGKTRLEAEREAAAGPDRMPAALSLIESRDRSLAAFFRPGQIVQEVVATCDKDDATVNTKFEDTGLLAGITPLFDNSVILAEAFIPAADARRVAGKPVRRNGVFRIYNSTDDVSGPESWFGRLLEKASDATAQSQFPIVTKMRYLVDSTAARTFVLQFRSGQRDAVEVNTFAGSCQALMALREIRR
jgi:hypothetical protein